MLNNVYLFLGVTHFNPQNIHNKVNETGVAKYPLINALISNLRRLARHPPFTIFLVIIRLLKLNKFAMKIINVNKKQIEEKPNISSELKESLLAFYSPDILKLEILLKMDLDHWKR